MFLEIHFGTTVSLIFYVVFLRRIFDVLLKDEKVYDFHVKQRNVYAISNNRLRCLQSSLT